MTPDRDDPTTTRDEIVADDQPSTADLAGLNTSTSETTEDRNGDGTVTDLDDARGTRDLPDAPASGTETSPREIHEPLLGEDELDGYRSRWQSVQVGFVDEPRDTVKEADALVAELMQRLAQTFAEERSALESQWESGTDVSTEDLRIAMQRYRSFFDRLLAA